MTRRTCRPALWVTVSWLAFAQAAAAEPVFIRAGKIYASPDQVIVNGALLIDDGTIIEVGDALVAPEGATIIDAPNGTVTAGLIDANAAVGFGDAVNRAEHRAECVPELRVLDQIDLEDPAFGRLAAAGVTTVHVSADGASVIGAQGTTLKTAGARRVVHEAHGVKATIGREPIFKASRNRNPFGVTSYLTRRPTTRMGLTWVFRKSFSDARIFAHGQTPPTRGEGSPSDASIPLLQGVLKGDIPLRIQARAQLDILTAIRVTQEFGIPSFILEEATDAIRCIPELKESETPVIFGPLFDYPQGFRRATGEANRYRYAAPAELLGAGLVVALSANDLSGEAALPHQAGYAMRFGLTRAQALAAVTSTPAKLLGLHDELGILAPGRTGDVVIWSGEPFEATTRAEIVLIGGRPVHGTDSKLVHKTTTEETSGG